MDIEEAMTLLGVSWDDDDDRVRRAYLKAVRRHPPERDPEGFQRVREAYELAKSRHFYAFLAEDDVEDADDPEPAEETAPATSPEASPVTPAPSPAPEAVEAAAAPEQGSDPRVGHEGVGDATTDAASFDEDEEDDDFDEDDDDVVFYPYEPLSTASREPTQANGERAAAWATRWIDEEHGPLPLNYLGMTVLELLAAGTSPAAGALTAAGQRWVTESGSELESAGDAPLFWIEARELVALQPTLTDDVVADVARALRDGDHTTAGSLCSGALSTPEARLDAELAAPLLSSLAMKARQRARRVLPSDQGSHSKATWMYWPLLLGVFAVIRALAGGIGGGGHDFSDRPKLRAARESMTDYEARSEIRRMLQHASNTCEPPEGKACMALTSALTMFVPGSCQEAFDAIAPFGRDTEVSTDPPFGDLLRRLGRYCAVHEPRPSLVPGAWKRGKSP